MGCYALQHKHVPDLGHKKDGQGHSSSFSLSLSTSCSRMHAAAHSRSSTQQACSRQYRTSFAAGGRELDPSKERELQECLNNPSWQLTESSASPSLALLSAFQCHACLHADNMHSGSPSPAPLV